MTGRLDKRVDKRQDKRQDSLDAIDRLMRQPGTLATIPPARPLHKMGRDDNDRDNTTGARP